MYRTLESCRGFGVRGCAAVRSGHPRRREHCVKHVAMVRLLVCPAAVHERLVEENGGARRELQGPGEGKLRDRGARRDGLQRAVRSCQQVILG